MIDLKTTFRTVLGATLTLALAATLTSQTPPPPATQRAGTAETRLVGVALFDSGLRLVSMFGSPDDIQPIGVGVGGVGGGAAPAGGPGAGPGGMRGPGGRPGPGGTVEAGAEMMGIRPGEILGDPFGFGAENSRQMTAAAPAAASPGGGAAPGPGGPAGPGAPAMGPGAPGGGGAPIADAANVQLTRWVYRRGGSRYSFVLDRWNRVVQIEAVGLRDNRVRTRRGISFGATFGQVMQAHRTPDGYDISGDSLLVRFILRDRVAFRLSRIEPNKPHRVTGIVVTAGKP